jgi:hypothetical protein
MTSTIGRLAVAVVLFAGAWLCRSEAQFAGRVADVKERMATLQFEPDDQYAATGVSVSDFLPGTAAPLSTEVRRGRAMVAYWLGAYGDVIGADRAEADPEILLAAANAAFRSSERGGESGAVQVQQLDGVLQAYAAALKTAPSADAAYNYEYVSRLRDQTASHAGKPAARPLLPAATNAGGLPSGPTIHGRPGAPPPEMKAEEFEVIAPMEYGDREAQPEATPGGKIQRKG